MKTGTTFPVLFGTLVTVTCDTGYRLEGSNTVTCDRDTTFTFLEQPACIQLGMFSLITRVNIIYNKYKVIFQNILSHTHTQNNYISECTGLDPNWDNLKTETKFPIVFGTVVEVTCDNGYKLEGSYTVTCDRDTTFTFLGQSACIHLGMFSLITRVNIIYNKLSCYLYSVFYSKTVVLSF